MKDDLLYNLRTELKNMLAVNKIDTSVNDGISYKKHIEVLQEQLNYLQGEIIEKNKIVCNLTSALTKIHQLHYKVANHHGYLLQKQTNSSNIVLAHLRYS